MAASLPSTAAGWTDWMVAFMAQTLGGGNGEPQRGRAPCSAAERALGQALGATWASWGYDVAHESFLCAPHAFLGAIPLAALAWVRALRSYDAQPRAAFVAAATGVSIFVLEVVMYREALEVLQMFPVAQGINVVARLAPLDGQPPAQRLIVSAHQDSAFEFNLFYYFRPVAVLMIIVAGVAQVLMLLMTALALVPPSLPQLHARVALARTRARPLLLAALPVMLACAFWHSGSVVPGAGDDLSGIAVLNAFGGVAAAARAGGGAGGLAGDALRPLLARTEVVLLATSGEEAGLRGAKRFVESHAAEFAAVPTAAVVLESTHDEAFLSVIRAEAFTRAVHDASLCNAAAAAAAALNASRPLRSVVLPLGATDGSAFTRAGVAAAVLQAVDVRTLPPEYHTRRDVLASVRPAALQAQLALLLRLAAAVGRGEWDGAPEALRPPRAQQRAAATHAPPQKQAQRAKGGEL